jgi:hypothetical protein
VDETYDKLPWYLARGAEEVLFVNRDSLALELFTSDGPVPADDDGCVGLRSFRWGAALPG